MNATLRILGGVTILVFGLVAFTPLPGALGQAIAPVEQQLRPADAIVILGGGIDADGELSRSSLKRAIRGIELYHLGYSQRLLFLGPARLEEGPSEAELRSRLAETLQVDPAAIAAEAGARTTREEAELTAERLMTYGVRSILLVSDRQHLVRARQLFEKAGFDVFPVPASDYAATPTSPEGRITLMKRIVEEQLALMYYRAAGYL